MDKNILNMFGGESMSDIQRIKARSSHAICGPQEREIVVKKSNVSKTIKTLEKSGFFIVGTGPGGRDSTKIWFNPRVSL